jgi:hypothetical protein
MRQFCDISSRSAARSQFGARRVILIHRRFRVSNSIQTQNSRRAQSNRKSGAFPHPPTPQAPDLFAYKKTPALNTGVFFYAAFNLTKQGVYFLDGPRRREAARCHCWSANWWPFCLAALRITTTIPRAENHLLIRGTPSLGRFPVEMMRRTVTAVLLALVLTAEPGAQADEPKVITLSCNGTLTPKVRH